MDATSAPNILAELDESPFASPDEEQEQTETRDDLMASERTGVFAPIDPRLYIGQTSARTRLSPPPLDPAESLERYPEILADEDRRYLAERQVALFGRRVTIFGDSLSYRIAGLNASIAGWKQITPMDGVYWESYELQQQRALAERDSIIQERAAAVRRRADGARQESPRAP